ncbi:RagB/SusD family nutrient uptake outer membrane protein [Dysgonomonas sp. 511]|uniref:RagB/SusD family nutrient uptake outer membrane protein n=1 Tax=Dysgonomonas sp. 511 TaxID=2302930 RepID=UPI0013D49636|nr:RagB/SusD family nutrient uptake outer membrane protein [Dysgonomonas sp. 511]NDV77673.1 RagB/SusD family nutrient uptake outer membrane protein [Dysgonomonas sp. 511]
MKKIYKYILPFIFLLGASSCDSYLDTMPDNRTELDTPDKIKALLVSAYSTTLPGTMIAEQASDNVDDNGTRWNSYWTRDQEEYYSWQDVTETSNDSPYFIWNSHYRAIASANTALQAIEEMGGSASLNPQKGEALICRAYNHFVLATLFCKAYGSTSNTDMGIPYMEKPETEVKPIYERGTVAEVYAKIEKDLLAALPLIDDNLYTVPKYHFNKKAAYAFAARFYLYSLAAGDNTEKLNNIIKYTSEILTSNPASMLRDWKSLYSTTDDVAITNSYVSSSTKATLMNIRGVSTWGRTSGPGYLTGCKYCHNSFISENETINSSGFWTRGAFHMRSWGYTGYPKQFALKLTEYFELLDPVGGTGRAHVVLPVFTADEALLVRAEAYALKGEFSLAVADLHLFMSHFSVGSAGLMTLDKINAHYGDNNMQYYKPEAPTHKKKLNQEFAVAGGSMENLIHCILQLRRILTIHEGLRWHDIKRYRIEIARRTLLDGQYYETTDILTKDDDRRAFQLPQDVIDAGLTPNPRSKK